MSERRPVPSPPAWLTILEQRALFELGAFLAASPALRLIGRGDRHPVLVLPGFTASDTSTVPLRWMLRSQGYWVHSWNLGRNLGPTQQVVDGLDQRMIELYNRHQRPITIIGWSLGGIYARWLARRHPKMVRQVVTLGSPYQMQMGDSSRASPLVERLIHSFSDEFFDTYVLPEAHRPPIGVPVTSIYSKQDGVVAWYTCIDKPGPQRENIEVRGTHTGLGFNPAVLVAIADRLAQREGHWKPFRSPPGLGGWYPRPEEYRAA
ncbi:MAG TPA: alpha/beta fold hydrolase [Acidimicrobiales bacterium]